MSKAAKKERVTSIQVTKTVKDDLEELKEHGDSYTHVIRKLLDFWDENHE